MNIRAYNLYLYICIIALYVSIALRASNSDDCPTGLPEFATGMMFGSPEFSVAGQRGEAIVENDDGRSSSLSSSSIGRISYDSAAAGDVDGDGEEVQSSAKGGALDSLEHLEEALPLKYVALIPFSLYFIKLFLQICLYYEGLKL
ncbi:PREDICTED: uncharacterized protein LOC109193206 [Ipomoea nil]|uniref:uncharacterized protein LOC109193206 n=1 Tax=Ipomoea nil TaxID=35883 RepID=UPI000901A3B6|nr:PREDICTED: uncharacterized protein LOC109193206 [Ipomoea nil]